MAISFPRLESITAALKVTQQTGNSFHVTFVYHGSKLICIANNDCTKLHREHKFGKNYGKYKVSKEPYISGVHGEAAALIKLGLTDCSHLTFVNIRIKDDGTPGLSKPCPNCQRILDQVGYKRIWYYDGNNYVKYN